MLRFIVFMITLTVAIQQNAECAPNIQEDM
jgi:hypothetical protein